MTTINTRITPLGETTDGKNFNTGAIPCEIKYLYEEVVAEWDGKAYTIEEIKKILTHMEYVEQLGG